MVYFRQKADNPNGLIYIGKSENHLESRIRQHQQANEHQLVVLAVIEDAKDDLLYHSQFTEDWERGSFFRPSTDLLDFISRLPKNKWTNYLIPMAYNEKPVPTHEYIKKLEKKILNKELTRKLIKESIEATNQFWYLRNLRLHNSVE
jgi:hypothetical protein